MIVMDLSACFKNFKAILVVFFYYLKVNSLQDKQFYYQNHCSNAM